MSENCSSVGTTEGSEESAAERMNEQSLGDGNVNDDCVAAGWGCVLIVELRTDIVAEESDVWLSCSIGVCVRPAAPVATPSEPERI